MSHKTSAGFLLKSRGLYLICHTTQGKNPPSETDFCWSISKGIVEDGEYEIEAAIRELKEETGISILDFVDIDKTMKPFNTYQLKKKTVKVFFAEDISGLLLNQPLQCNSFVPVLGYPEMDAFKWVTKEEARNMVFISQKHLFEGE